jgi:hypothetical protein
MLGDNARHRVFSSYIMNAKARTNLLYLIIAIVLIVLTAATYTTVGMIPHTLAQLNGVNDGQGIYDVGFELVDRAYRIPSEQCNSKLIYETVHVSFFVAFIIYAFGRVSINVVLRLLYTIVILNVLKRLFATITVLPNPRRNKCWPLYNGHNPNKGICNDLFFSGHFILVNMVGFLIWRYLWSPTIAGLYALFYAFFVYWNLSCQYHYSIDIVASIPITLAVATLMFQNVKN